MFKDSKKSLCTCSTDLTFLHLLHSLVFMNQKKRECVCLPCTTTHYSSCILLKKLLWIVELSAPNLCFTSWLSLYLFDVLSGLWFLIIAYVCFLFEFPCLKGFILTEAEQNFTFKCLSWPGHEPASHSQSTGCFLVMKQLQGFASLHYR